MIEEQPSDDVFISEQRVKKDDDPSDIKTFLEKYDDREGYFPVLHLMFGTLFGLVMQDAMTGRETDRMPVFIKWLNSKVGPKGLKMGDEMLKSATSAALHMKELIDAEVGVKTEWFPEVSFTFSPAEAHLVNVLKYDPEVLNQIRTLGFSTLAEFTKSVSRGDVEVLDKCPQEPINELLYRLNPISEHSKGEAQPRLQYTDLSAAEKLALFVGIVRAYYHYDHNRAHLAKATQSVGARADLIGLSYDGEDPKIKREIQSLRFALKHHLHTLTMSQERSATSVAHLHKVRKGAERVLRGEISAHLVEVKTDFGEKHLTPDQIRTQYLDDLSHQLLAIVQFITHLTNIARPAGEQGEGDSVGDLFQKLMDSDVNVRQDAFRRMRPLIMRMITQHHFYIAHFQSDVLSPLEKDTTIEDSSRSRKYCFYPSRTTQEPEVQLVKVEGNELLRAAIARGALLIEEYIRRNPLPDPMQMPSLPPQEQFVMPEDDINEYAATPLKLNLLDAVN